MQCGCPCGVTNDTPGASSAIEGGARGRSNSSPAFLPGSNHVADGASSGGGGGRALDESYFGGRRPLPPRGWGASWTAPQPQRRPEDGDAEGAGVAGDMAGDMAGDGILLGGDSRLLASSMILGRGGAGGGMADSVVNITHMLSGQVGVSARIAALAGSGSNRVLSRPVCRDCLGATARAFDEQTAAADAQLANLEALLAAVRAVRTADAADLEENGGGEKATEAEDEETEKVGGEAKASAASGERAQLERALASMREALTLVEGQRAQLREDTAAMAEEEAALAAEETALWGDAAALEVHAERWRRERDGLLRSIEVAEGEREHLLHGSLPLVLELFAIDLASSYPFGTVNGLRLGRLPSAPVGWDEINAALGHTALLQERLVAHSRVRLSRGKRLMPCGSASKVVVQRGGGGGGSEVLELFGSAAPSFDVRRFNAALGAWLECVAETAAHVRAKHDGRYEDAPFAIVIGGAAGSATVGGLPIAMSHDTATWTKAMLRALGHLRQLLLWMARTTPQ